MHLLLEPQKHERKWRKLNGNVDTNNKCGEGVEKGNPPTLLVGM